MFLALEADPPSPLSLKANGVWRRFWQWDMRAGEKKPSEKGYYIIHFIPLSLLGDGLGQAPPL